MGAIVGVPAAAAGGAIVVGSALNAGRLVTTPIHQKSGSGQASNPYAKQTDEQLVSSRDSYRGLVKEHRQKLRDYKANPDAADNRGILRGAPNAQVRDSIIQGRIKVLKQQIKKQVGELRKIMNEIERRGL